MHHEPAEPVIAPATMEAIAPQPSLYRLPVTFTGTGNEYFRIWIVNLLLTLVTFGIYSAWAKVRRTQYFCRNTRLDGSVFDYHGRPLAILKGRAIAVLLLLGYNVAVGVSIGWMIAALAALGVVMPWLLLQSMRFRLHNISYRGLRFRFEASARQAYGVFGLPFLAIGLVVLAAVLAARFAPATERGDRAVAAVVAAPGDLDHRGPTALRRLTADDGKAPEPSPAVRADARRDDPSDAKADADEDNDEDEAAEAQRPDRPVEPASAAAVASGIAVMVLALLVALAAPWQHWRLKRFQHDGARYGQAAGRMTGGPAAFYGSYALAVLFTCLAVGAGMVVVGVGFGIDALRTGKAGTFGFVAVAAVVVLVYAVALAMVPFVSARVQNTAWSRTTLGGIGFDSHVGALRMAWIATSNLVLVLLTFGLFTPFAAVRSYRYRVESVAVLAGADDLAAFVGTAGSGDIGAAGEGAADLFDVDFAL